MSFRLALLVVLATVVLIAAVGLFTGEPVQEPAQEPAPAPTDEPDEPYEPDEPDERGSSPDPGFDLELLAKGFDQPLYVTHAGDGSGRLFIVERTGKVVIWRDGRLLREPFIDLGHLIGARGAEQGLLSIAFHPDFAKNGYVFLSYTARDDGSVIARYRIRADDPDRLDPGSAGIILRVAQPYRNHNGGLIKFGPDGHLYFGLGDGGAAGDPHGHGQNRRTLLGAILRLGVGGSGSGGGEIWAFGLRNPWRFSFDRETGDLYIGDVGQDAREEINFQPAGSRGGRNYGWNVWEGSSRFRSDLEPASEVAFPVAEYRIPQDGCAVTGGYVYRGDAIPALRGIYVFGDFCSGTIWGLRQRGGRDNRVDGEWRMAELLRTGLRISSFGEDEDGELYVVDHGGAVHRFVPGENRVPAALTEP